MTLSDKDILDCMKKGTVVISPFNKEQLNTSSYDITLGEFYYQENPSKNNHPIYNPYKERHTKHVWGEPKRAQKAKDVLVDYNINWDDYGILPDDKIILIAPGETILAHTQEFIGGRVNVTTQMQARSSIGRNFIEVCKCAGWGDVGYINRWTMEITNNSRFYMIPLVIGRRVGQIVFYETGPIIGADYATSGKYSHSGNLAQLKKDWKPEMMLPKMYLDREAKAARATMAKKARAKTNTAKASSKI